MGKIIKLPGGVMFDPETGEINGGSFGSAPRISRPTQHYTGYHRDNFWGRLNNVVTDIGDWFADNAASITNYIGIGLFILAWVGFGIAVISTWVNQGFFWALLAGVIGGVIFYYVSLIVLGILIAVMTGVLWIVRYVFYNAWTLVITLAVVGGLMILGYTSDGGGRSRSRAPVSAPAATTRYRCTAQTSLNVRYAPDKNSRVIGSLKPNQVVEVHGQSNGFAKIKYGDGFGYASMQYLRKE